MKSSILRKNAVNHWSNSWIVLAALIVCSAPAGAQTQPSQCTAITTPNWGDTVFPLTEAEAEACWPNDTNFNVATEIDNILESSGCAGALVARTRANSSFQSTLSSSTLKGNLSLLLRWMVKDYMNGCINTNTVNDGNAIATPMGLLSDDPQGNEADGLSTNLEKALQNTYWLEDNEDYGAAALSQYTTYIGAQLTSDWQTLWGTASDSNMGLDLAGSDLCDETGDQYVTGTLPAWDNGGSSDPNCSSISAPATGAPPNIQRYTNQQYPASISGCADENGNYPTLPIIGTISITEVSGVSGTCNAPTGTGTIPSPAPIKTGEPRNLLKYGCLREVLKGDPTDATTMFEEAIDTWQDGLGFYESTKKVSDFYYTRDLALALMCANALNYSDDVGGTQYFQGTSQSIEKSAVEDTLWDLQETNSEPSNANNGGIFVGYCTNGFIDVNGNPCQMPYDDVGSSGNWGLALGGIQSEEIAPLVLLAYGANIW